MINCVSWENDQLNIHVPYLDSHDRVDDIIFVAVAVNIDLAKMFKTT